MRIVSISSGALSKAQTPGSEGKPCKKAVGVGPRQDQRLPYCPGLLPSGEQLHAGDGEEEGDDEDHQEYHEQDLGDLRGGGGHAAETEKPATSEMIRKMIAHFSMRQASNRL